MRFHMWLLVACVTLSHACDGKKDKDNAKSTGSGSAVQSMPAALSIICDPSYWPKFEEFPVEQRAEKLKAWMAEKVTNPEVVAFMKTVPDMNPAEREAKIKAFAAPHVVFCEPLGKKSHFDQLATSVVVPRVDRGTDRLPDQGWTIVVTERGITIDGTSIIAVENGAIPKSELDPTGKPVRVAEYLKKLAETAHSTGRSFETVHLVIDEKLPLLLAIQLAHAAPESVKRLMLIVRSQDALAGLPFSVPKNADGMVLWLQVIEDAIVLSVKGGDKPAFEGKLEPAAERRTKLRAVLAEMLTKAPVTRIDISLAAEHTIGQLADVIATVRAADDGKPLMTDVRVIDPMNAPKQDDAQTLQDDVVANHAPLKKCFQQSLTRDGPTQGHKVEMRITVDDKGGVTDTKATGDGLPPALEKCLVDATKTWKLKVKAGKYKFPLVMKPA